MKKLFVIAMAAGLGLSSAAFAQTEEQDTTSANYHYKEGVEKTQEDVKQGAENTAEDVKEGVDNTASDVRQGAENAEENIEQGAEQTGDKAAELGANGAAQIKDEMKESKVGPQGQSIYIDEDAKYYYINDQGNKVFIAESELKDKPE